MKTDDIRTFLPHLAAQRLGPPANICPDCTVERGARHHPGCDQAACAYSGFQHIQCGPGEHAPGYATRDCATTVFDGYSSGDVDAARNNLWERWANPASASGGRIRCEVTDAAAEPASGFVALLENCTWNPESERWEPRA